MCIDVIVTLVGQTLAHVVKKCGFIVKNFSSLPVLDPNKHKKIALLVHFNF